MKLVIFGARGMLGKALTEEAERRDHQTIALGRECDIANQGDVRTILFAGDPAVVINAAGRIRGRHTEDIEMIRTNAIGPFILAEECDRAGVHFIHVSTDCVFSGSQTEMVPYNSFDRPDATDIYGRSKMLGESFPKPSRNKVESVIIRTSFIGLEHGLLRWLLDNDGECIEGWTRAKWSGSTVWEVARGLLDIAAAPFPPDVVHLATPRPHSKADVLKTIRNALALNVEIVSVPGQGRNRGLVPTWTMRDIGDQDILAEIREKVEAWRATL